MTMLRNIVGGMTLEQTLTSVRTSTAAVRRTRRGHRPLAYLVGRVEIKGIDLPPSIKDSMEKQMRARPRQASAT